MQVDASPLQDVITEAEAKEPQAVAPAPPPANVKTMDVDEDEEDLEDLTAPPYEEKVGINSDDEEEKDAEYSSFVEREDAAPPFSYAGGPAAFDDFNEDDDQEDEDHA